MSSRTETFLGRKLIVNDDGSAYVSGRLFLDEEEARDYIRKKNRSDLDTLSFRTTMTPLSTSFGAQGVPMSKSDCYGIMEMSRKDLFRALELSRKDLFAGDAFIDTGAFRPTMNNRMPTSRASMFDDSYGALKSRSLSDELRYGALDSDSLEDELGYGALSNLALQQELRYVNDIDKRLDSSPRLRRKQYR